MYRCSPRCSLIPNSTQIALRLKAMRTTKMVWKKSLWYRPSGPESDIRGRRWIASGRTTFRPDTTVAAVGLEGRMQTRFALRRRGIACLRRGQQNMPPAFADKNSSFGHFRQQLAHHRARAAYNLGEFLLCKFRHQERSARVRHSKAFRQFSQNYFESLPQRHAQKRRVAINDRRPYRIDRLGNLEQRLGLQALQNFRNVMPGEQCYATIGKRSGVEHLRSLAGSVGEIGVSNQVARSRQFDQHPIA